MTPTRWCALGIVAVSALFAGAALLLPACGSCKTCGDGDASGTDATTSPPMDAGDAGDMTVCTICPPPDAALFNPNGTTCCAGGSCVAQHTDGFSHTFYDCYGVYSWCTPLALDACRAYFDASSPCVATTCGVSEVVEGTGPTCVTWAYEGSDISTYGHVRKSDGGACECPDGGDPLWY